MSKKIESEGTNLYDNYQEARKIHDGLIEGY